MIPCINIEEALYKLTKDHKVFEKITRECYIILERPIIKSKLGLLWESYFNKEKIIVIFLNVYNLQLCCFIWGEKNGLVYWGKYSYNENIRCETNSFNRQYFYLMKIEPFYDYCLKNSKFINTSHIKNIIIEDIHKSNCISLRNENDFIKYKPLLGIIQFLEQNKILATHNIYYCINDNVYIIGDKNTNKYRLIEYTSESKCDNEIIYLKNTIANSYIELIAYYDNLKISISYSYSINKLISIISKKNHNYIKIMTNKIDYSGHINKLIY